ncbi:unnamed protein product [Closterium sp. NIES-54]
MATTTTPGGQRVSISMCTRTGRHLATFTRQPGSSLYTLATKPPQVVAFAQVSASGPVAPRCSCHLLSHQTLLWHHHLGHPSLPRLRGMHSRLLVSGLPRSLPPLPPSPAPPCLPCVEGRQRAAPHSSSFPPTNAPLLTLHMDSVSSSAIGSARTFPSYVCTLTEFSSDLLRDFCHWEGILQSFTLPDSPQQNGIAEHRIDLVMEVARTSMIHAAAPHLLWPFAIWYAAHQLNLWPRDVTFDEWIPFYRLFPYHSAPPPPPPLFLAPGPPPIDPLAPQGPPPSGVSQINTLPCTALFEVAVGSGAARGDASGGAESEGAGSGGAEPGVAETEGAESRGAKPGVVELGGTRSEDAESGGAEPRGAASSGDPAGASPSLSPRTETLSPQQLLTAGAGGTGGTAAAGPGGALTGGTGAAGTGGVGGAGAGGAGAVGAGAGGTSAGGAGAHQPARGDLAAPPTWLHWLVSCRTTLADLGFAPSTSDPSLFLRTDTSLPPFYVLVYVDDLVFATADTKALTLVKLELQKRHTCCDLNELCSYVGLQITWDRARRTTTLTQSHIVHQVLHCFGFLISSPQPTPLSTGHSLSAPPSDESIEPIGLYPELVSCLMHLMTCTRPDLAYPLSLLARYVAPGRHRKVHWDAAKRVLCYLRSNGPTGDWRSRLAGLLEIVASGLLALQATRQLPPPNLPLTVPPPFIGSLGRRGCVGMEVTPVEDTAASTRRPRPVSPPGFPSVPQFPPRSSLQPVATEPGGVPAGGTRGTGCVGGGCAGSRGARAGGTGTLAPTPHTVRFLTRDQHLLRMEREERERFEGAQKQQQQQQQQERVEEESRLHHKRVEQESHLQQQVHSGCSCSSSRRGQRSHESSSRGRYRRTVFHDPLSDYLRSSRPVVSRVLSTLVTHPTAPLSSDSAVFTTVAGFASSHRLDYAAHLVSGSARSPFFGGAPVFPLEVLEDRQFELGFLAATVPHLCAMLLAPAGDLDALDIPIPRTHTEAVSRPWASYWIAAEEAEMASYRSTGTYVNAVPPPGTNVVGGMWIYEVKRPPGAPPVFKARYMASGFSQQEGVDFFQTFAPTPKMTTLRGSLHEQIWLRRPPSFTGSFTPGTQWQLRGPVYGLRQAPREWHDMLRTTLAALDFFPSSADPSLFVHRGSTPFFVLVYIDNLVFTTPNRRTLASVKEELQRRHTCTDLGEQQRYLGLQITKDRAARTITLTQWHMVERILTRSTQASSVFSSGCEAEVYAAAMAAQELRWLSFLHTDLGERPRSPPVFFADNRSAILLCEEPRLVGKAKHIQVRYFLLQEFQQCGQALVQRVVSEANTADIFTNALPPWLARVDQCLLIFLVFVISSHSFTSHYFDMVHGPLPSPPIPLVGSLSSSPWTRRSPLSHAVSPEHRRSRYRADGLFHLVLHSHIPPPPVLPQPPKSPLIVIHNPLSDYLCATRPVVSRVLSALVTHPTSPPCLSWLLLPLLLALPLPIALSTPLTWPSKDKQLELGFLAAVVPHLCAMLLAPEGDPDALDIPIPHTHAKAVSGPRASYGIAAEEAQMASYRSTSTYIDTVPPPGANVVSGMWHYKVKQPPGSPPVSKACYLARGFSQREGEDFFQTFPPTPKMTTLWAPCEWHDTICTTLAALDFFPSSADPSLFVRLGSTPFFVIVYVDNLVFATTDGRALASAKEELLRRHTCTDLGELQRYLGLQITRDRAARTITMTHSHMVEQILTRFRFPFSKVQPTPLAVDHGLTDTPSSESFESSCPYLELVDRLILGTGAVLWRSTRASTVSSSYCEAEVYAAAMAAQELRWLSFLHTDLGERPRSPPILFDDNRSAILLCKEP